MFDQAWLLLELETKSGGITRRFFDVRVVINKAQLPRLLLPQNPPHPHAQSQNSDSPPKTGSEEDTDCQREIKSWRINVKKVMVI